MLKTAICNLLGIRYPIIQAGMGPFTSAELAAAVSNAGGLGSLGVGGRSFPSHQEQLTRVTQLTAQPFAVNHTLSPVLPDEEAFSLTLRMKPRLISFALGNPAEYVRRVHDAGILAMHQVSTVQQAYQAAESGVDIIIAQGTEAGGFGGTISALALIPQVVDAVSPIPVVAAGGIADGRGLAAALALGAQGVNVGTRFLASSEAPISAAWKQAILAAESQDTLKVEFWKEIFPASGQAYLTTPRTLASPFIDKWMDQDDMIAQQAGPLQAEVVTAIRQGRFGELFPFTGQSAGLIRDILPAAEIVQRMVLQAEAVIKHVSASAM